MAVSTTRSTARASGGRPLLPYRRGPIRRRLHLLGHLVSEAVARSLGPLAVSRIGASVDGIEGICDRCQICVRRCPVGAITNVRKGHRGITKAKINTKRCLPLMMQSAGCSICMKVCPVQRYGLPAVLRHYEHIGQILGKETDDLEGYDWPLDGRHYGPGTTPHVPDCVVRPPGFQFDPARTTPVAAAPAGG